MDVAAFRKSFEMLGASPPSDDIYAELVALLSEPNRAYHNLDHVADCLALLDEYGELVEHRAEVELAIWYHDAVYDARAADNEERSAGMAEVVLVSAGAPAAVVQRIRDLILATKTHRAQTSDEELLIDIDLSILGRPWGTFCEYDQAIRKEYSWVSDEEFRSGRRRVLAGFLERDRIYVTEQLHQRFDQQARTNLGRWLQGR